MRRFMPGTMPELRHEVGTPEEVVLPYWDQVPDLRRAYYDRTIGHVRTQRQIDRMVDQTTPNTFCSPEAAGLRGRHARVGAAAALVGGRLVAYSLWSDVASSSLPGLAGTAEQVAKLYRDTPKFLRARYHQEREVVDNGAHRHARATVIDLGASQAHPDQAFSRWLHMFEDELIDESRAMGLELRPGTTELVRPFGKDAHVKRASAEESFTDDVYGWIMHARTFTAMDMYATPPDKSVTDVRHNLTVGSPSAHEAILNAIDSSGVYDNGK